MALIWKIELRDKSTIKVGDPWPEKDLKANINAILHIPSTEEVTGIDEDGDPITTRHSECFVVTVLPEGQDPKDEDMRPLMRVFGKDVLRTFEVHTWAELRDIVADALGLDEEEEEEGVDAQAPTVAAPAPGG